MLELHTRYAQTTDANHLIVLKTKVQAALTESGSLQQIGPLLQADVEQASTDHHCYLLEERQPRNEILGCAFVKRLSTEADVSHELGARGLATVSHIERPWLYLHAVMLQPTSQGHGLGARLIDDFITALKLANVNDGGTVLLNCWAGNEKLRAFYASAGFRFLSVVPKHDYEIAIFYKQLDRAS